MATVVCDDEVVAQITRILESLFDERSRLKSGGDAALLDANRIAIAYWRDVLETQLAGHARSGGKTGHRELEPE